MSDDLIKIVTEPIPTFNIPREMSEFIKDSQRSNLNDYKASREARVKDGIVDISQPVRTEAPLPNARAASSGGQRQPRDAGGSETTHHPWKTVEGEDDADDIATWNVTGGTLYGQVAAPIVVADAILTGATGEIFLLVERDLSTRQMISATLTLSETVPESFDQLQYIHVATVGGVVSPIQRLFEDVRVWEDLVVENGEFALISFSMAVRNSYAV